MGTMVDSVGYFTSGVGATELVAHSAFQEDVKFYLYAAYFAVSTAVVLYRAFKSTNNQSIN